MVAIRAKAFFKRILSRKLISRLQFEGDIVVKPLSDVFGIDRGTPLDRVFIRRFLQHYGKLIRGDCLEVEESTYTRQFGQPGHVAYDLKFAPSSSRSSKNHVMADLTRPETVPEARFDTFICTQTLNFIFNLDPVIDSIHKLLKPGGHSLITVAGISQISRYDYERWGDYWRFTEQSLRNLLLQRFDEANCRFETYGNVTTSCLFLQGVAYEDLRDKSILDEVDKNYQMVICALVKK